jgi:hypothetical protein
MRGRWRHLLCTLQQIMKISPRRLKLRRVSSATSAQQRAVFCVLVLLHSTVALAKDEADAMPWHAMPTARLPERLPVEANSAWTVKAEATQFEAADATAVRALSGDWSNYRPRGGRNVALQSARLELSASKAQWEVGAALRSDIVIDGSRGAFDIVHAYKQKREPASGSEFNLDATEQGVIWAGLRGARTWVLRPGTEHGLQLTTALTLLSVRRIQLTDVSGSVSFNNAAGFDFKAQTTQRDSHVQFGGYGKEGAVGGGYTTDIGLLWQPTARSFVNLSISDTASRLRVKQVATEQMSASSTTRLFDSNGYLDYHPLLNGRDSAQDVSLRLSRKTSLSAGTRVDFSAAMSVVVGARWEHIAGIHMPSVWAAVPMPGGLSLQLDADTRFNSFGVGINGRFGSVMLRSQSTSVSASRALGWQASLNFPW